MTMTPDLFSLTAEDLMSREVITLAQDTPFPVAARSLSQAHVDGAPVLDRQGRCIGAFSAGDLERRAQCEQRAARMAPAVPGCVCSEWEVVEHDWDTLPADAVSWYMTARPALALPSTPIGELARMMVDGHVHWLIVASADRRPTGIVSSADVMAALARAAREEK